jgi:hypothetical protein
MLYYAYGSNINLDHLTNFLDQHGVILDTELRGQHAFLHNFQLRTNYFAGTHGAGACNIEPAPDHHVEGVIITVTPAIRDALRVKEGFPNSYHEIDVIVRTAAAQTPVRAFTYVVTPELRLEIDLPVTRQYRSMILAGARHFRFSKSYQKTLRDKLQTAPYLSRIARQFVSP